MGGSGGLWIVVAVVPGEGGHLGVRWCTKELRICLSFGDGFGVRGWEWASEIVSWGKISTIGLIILLECVTEGRANSMLDSFGARWLADKYTFIYPLLNSI